MSKPLYKDKNQDFLKYKTLAQSDELVDSYKNKKKIAFLNPLGRKKPETRYAGPDKNRINHLGFLDQIRKETEEKEAETKKLLLENLKLTPEL